MGFKVAKSSVGGQKFRKIIRTKYALDFTGIGFDKVLECIFDTTRCVRQLSGIEHTRVVISKRKSKFYTQICFYRSDAVIKK